MNFSMEAEDVLEQLKRFKKDEQALHEERRRLTTEGDPAKELSEIEEEIERLQSKIDELIARSRPLIGESVRPGSLRWGMYAHFSIQSEKGDDLPRYINARITQGADKAPPGVTLLTKSTPLAQILWGAVIGQKIRYTGPGKKVMICILKGMYERPEQFPARILGA